MPTEDSTPATSQQLPPSQERRQHHGGSAYEAARRGGHLKGNFPNYYSFHQPRPRVEALLGMGEEEDGGQQQQKKKHQDNDKHLPLLQQLLSCNGGGDRSASSSSSSSPLLVADWGCNSGDLTMAFCQRLQQLAAPLHVAALGLDLDESLIKKARELVTKQEEDRTNEGLEMTFAAVDLVAEKEKVAKLMQAFVEKYNKKQQVDLLTIFSTTMWIHLRHGDAGLKELLRLASSWARCLVIETQDAKSYKTAKTRLRRLGLDPVDHFCVVDTIFGSKALSDFLLSDKEKGGGGFDEIRNLGKSSSWNRDLLFFWRREDKAGEEEGSGTEEEGKKTKKRPREEDGEEKTSTKNV